MIVHLILWTFAVASFFGGALFAGAIFFIPEGYWISATIHFTSYNYIAQKHEAKFAD